MTFLDSGFHHSRALVPGLTTTTRKVHATRKPTLFLSAILLLVGTAWEVLPLHAQLDDSWTVSVDGQSVQVARDGSFRIPNVAVRDNFGAGGPGTPRDFIGDDFVRLTGVSTADGVTRYALSAPFQVGLNTPTPPVDIVIQETPPLFPESIRIDSPGRVVALGETLQLTVTGVLGDGTEAEMTPEALWTTYRVSNPSIATVSEDGLVTPQSVGHFVVFAGNSGAMGGRLLEGVSDVVTTTVEGFVVTESGERVAGASVESPFSSSVTSDTNGFFSSEASLPTGETLSLSVSGTVGGVDLRTNVANVAVFVDGITDVGLVTVEVDSSPPAPEGFTFLRTNSETGLSEYVQDLTGIEFVLLPGGDFQMGSPSDEFGRWMDEGPVHTVTLSSFLIGKYEITQAEYAAVMAGHATLSAEPSDFKTDTLPVENVSWDDLKDPDGFLVRTGLSLPSEAQWEYACRGGTQTAFSFDNTCHPDDIECYFSVPCTEFGPYCACPQLNNFMWWCGNFPLRPITESGPQIVGTKLPNPFGLHDMHGNLSEWCEDIYNDSFYANSEATGPDPVATTGSTARVLRGGYWRDADVYCRSAYRSAGIPDSRGFSSQGFRPARPLP
jgi:formylglycine-generating enzyme required for sulfatase activity